MNTAKKTTLCNSAKAMKTEMKRFDGCKGRSAALLWLVALMIVLTGTQAQAQQYYWKNFVGTASPDFGGTANGTGTAALFSSPEAVAVDGSGNIYIADYGNHMIRKSTPGGVVTTLAGSAGVSGTADGTGTAALFDFPGGVAVDGSGNVYVADIRDDTIRKVTPGGVVTTLAGSPGVEGSADGTGGGAKFNWPSGVAVDGSGNVYVGDSKNNTIRKVTPGGVVTTLAGRPGVSGTADGSGSAARFSNPQGVVVDGSGNLYIADERNYTIRMLTPLGQVTTLAGNGVQASVDGTGRSAEFGSPGELAFDKSGNLYVADGTAIRKMTLPGTAVITIGGTMGMNGMADGLGEAAQFNQAYGVAVSGSGIIYIADGGNNRISAGSPVTTSITPSTLPNWTINYGYTAMLSGTGGTAPYSLALTSGTLPPGLKLSGSATLSLSGTPSTTGTWNFTIGVTDSGSNSSSQSYSVIVNAAVSITTSSLAAWTISEPGYSQVVSGSGGTGSIAFAVTSGSLPAGLSLSGSTGAISGIPTAVATDNFTIMATDTIGSTASHAFTLTINGAPSIVPAVLPYPGVNQFYSQTISAANGTGAKTFAVTSGTLPVGLSLGGSSGLLSGTPTIAGTDNFTLTATDSVGATGSQAYMMIVTTGTFAANEDLAFTPGVSGVVIPILNNDTATSSGSLSIVSVTQGSMGRVIVNSNGTVTYTPFKTYTGEDSFTYTVTDGGNTTIQTVLVGNGFITAAGSYAGLITNGTNTNGNSGYLNATLTNSGKFSGKLYLAGLSYSVKGTFGTDWEAPLSIKRAGQTNLTGTLQLDPANRQIVGTVSSGTIFSSTVAAERLPYDGKNFLAQQAGSFTVALPPETSGTDYPQGDGYLSLTVTKGGSVTAKGELGDGTAVSASGLLVTGSSFPLYVGIYGSKYPTAGSILGTVALSGTGAPTDLCSGTLTWFKPAQTSGNYYRAGFTTTTVLIGSRYIAPKKTRALNLSGPIAVTLDGGDLAASVNRTITLSTANKVAVTNAPSGDKVKLTLTVTPTTGAFSGSFYDTGGSKSEKRTFSGVLLQNQLQGGGLFLGTNESGVVEFGVAP